MVNGVINIRVFEAMDSIAQEHGVKDGEWATAAFGRQELQSRISELRAKARAERDNLDYTGRAFSFQKCADLLKGLRELIGEESMAKEVLKLLARAETTRERILLLALAIPKADEKQVEMYLRAVVDRQK